MTPRFRPVFIRFALTVLFLCGLFPCASAREAPVVSDSVLRAYYSICRTRLHEPEGPACCDTLFMRAGDAGNVRMQAVALCLRLDHFYYANDRDAIAEHVRRVQEFCVRHGKRELSYFYYFVWSSRLVTFHIKQHQFNIAIYETRRMLAEAESEGYMQGVADCYRMLGNIYLSQNAPGDAYENLHKCIDVLERHGIGDINMPTHYASLIQSAVDSGQLDSARVALRKVRDLSKDTDYQRFTVEKASALYYIAAGDFPAAEACLRRSEALFRENPGMEQYIAGLNYLRRVYYEAVRDYPRALEALRLSRRDSLLRASDYQYHSLARDMGNIYWLMGDARRAAEHYREYIRAADSVRTREVRNATDDFSGILELGRLQNQTKQLQLDLQHKRLHSTYAIICLLVFLLLVGGLILARIVKITRRMRASEQRVIAQNEELKAAGAELSRARERAEQASRMKSDFIQNMSHEVRTPLNSIVGFSRIVASQARSGESAEFADIIEQSSTDLMRLIDDVLDIALLDQTDELPRPDCCEMLNRCRDCADRMLEKVKPGVSLVFESGLENPVVWTNARRVEQVLLHLLHNAAKFTDKGQITLCYDAFPACGTLRFTVTDTGPGIAPGHREEVFERFVKLDPFSQGTGLGLPICRIIAEKLGGTLRVDPDYVRGCRMIFEIPCEPA